ncbi:MAG: ABC transporter ATP-binding protein [Candidatus Sumerlaeota bacterium]|nr:ABC transporter ATP-binding protein [Candidatus Sumerlaeota bacterium]
MKTSDASGVRNSGFSDIISVSGVSKRYRITTESSGRAASLFFHRLASRSRRADLWALRDVSFEARGGEILGLVGVNGAGKSTLLRVLTGITQADAGGVRRPPRIAALLDLSAGFHPSLTGYENLFLGASLIGIPREELRARLPEIAAFSGVNPDYLETPVRYYSSGMLARLGFALAVNTDPDAILIDEVLAVGDAEFQERSARRLLEFRDQGKAMILASHTVGVIQHICARALWLDNGSVRALGKSNDIIRDYQFFLNTRIQERRGIDEHRQDDEERGETDALPGGGTDRHDIRFNQIALDDGSGRRPEKFATGGALRFCADIIAREPVRGASLIIRVLHDNGSVIDEFTSAERGQPLPDSFRQLRITARFDPLILYRGHFILEILLADSGTPHSILARNPVIHFEVEMPYTAPPAVPADMPCEFEAQ